MRTTIISCKGEILRSIWLKGSTSAVNELKLRVEEIINNRLSQLGNKKDADYAFVLKIPVPNDKVGLIIGKGGMSIKAIQERTRSNVQVLTAVFATLPHE